MSTVDSRRPGGGTARRGAAARVLAGLAGLLAAVAVLVTAKAASAPPRRPVALAPAHPPGAGSGRSAPNRPAAPHGTRTVTGAVEDTPYGPVQVRVTLTGTRIADVAAVQLPGDGGRSQEISGYAAPQLRQEVLAAQSARIDTVSGASYTSDGYARSVQSALDAARAGG
jgi:uncharacterized protein with FMN-binding domain